LLYLAFLKSEDKQVDPTRMEVLIEWVTFLENSIQNKYFGVANCSETMQT